MLFRNIDLFYWIPVILILQKRLFQFHVWVAYIMTNLQIRAEQTITVHYSLLCVAKKNGNISITKRRFNFFKPTVNCKFSLSIMIVQSMTLFSDTYLLDIRCVCINSVVLAISIERISVLNFFYNWSLLIFVSQALLLRWSSCFWRYTVIRAERSRWLPSGFCKRSLHINSERAYSSPCSSYNYTSLSGSSLGISLL